MIILSQNLILNFKNMILQDIEFTLNNKHFKITIDHNNGIVNILHNFYTHKMDTKTFRDSLVWIKYDVKDLETIIYGNIVSIHKEFRSQLEQSMLSLSSNKKYIK